MRLTLSKVIAAVALVAMTAAPAAAQAKDDARPSVGVGVMFLKWVDFESTAKGLAVDFSKPVKLGGSSNWSAVGDLTWGKDDEETDFALGGGLRFTSSAGSKARVYFQGLVGIVRWSVSDLSDTSFMVAPGAGVLVPLNDRIDFKGQIDFFLPTNWEGDDGNLVRVFLGVNCKLGK